jgi:TadE-like protein
MAVFHSKWDRLSVTVRSWPAGAAAFAILVLAVSYRLYSQGQFHFFGDAASQELLPGYRLPQYSMFTSSFVRSILPLTVLGLVLGGLSLRISGAIARAKKIAPARNEDKESGTSAVEFVLVLPALAVLLLMILQIALIVQAKFVVNYAAFCAARSAVVVIPDDVFGRPSEPRNQVGNPDSSEKVEIIQRSAALPLTAISPLPGFSVARGVPVLTNPAVIADLVKLAPFDVAPRSMMGQVMLRAPYAYHLENTAVKVLTVEGTEGGSFRDHDWVTVKVQYRYYLAVPFAKKLFGTSYSGNPLWNIIFGTDYYYPIVEQYTLPVDGEPMLP